VRQVSPLLRSRSADGATGCWSAKRRSRTEPDGAAPTAASE
jgi:hypothetical protein